MLELLDKIENVLKQSLIEQAAIPQQQVERLLEDIDILNQQHQVSAKHPLLLKQMSLLLETLPELIILKNKLLALEIK